MEKFRDPNRDCFTCGAQVPNKVEHMTDGALEWFRCPDCYAEIMTGIVQRGDIKTAPIRVPSHIPDEALSVNVSSDWDTAEVWWSPSGEYVTMVHGRTIYGNPAVARFVEKLYDISV